MIDSRRGIQKIDEEVMDIMDNGSSCSYQIILTKVDLLRPKEVESLQIGLNSSLLHFFLQTIHNHHSPDFF